MKKFSFLYFLLLIPLNEIIKLIAEYNEAFVEKYYSVGIYPAIIKVLSSITGIFPFSLMEFIILGFILYCVYRVIRIIISIVVWLYTTYIKQKKGSHIYPFEKSPVSTSIQKHKQRLNHTHKLAHKNRGSSIYIKEPKAEIYRFSKLLVITLSCAYLSFTLLWSLNNYRYNIELNGHSNYSQKLSNEVLLVKSYTYVVEKVNLLRSNLPEDENGVCSSPSIESMIKAASSGYNHLDDSRFGFLKGSYGRPKPLFLFSYFQTASGYTGIYSPFTGEPNINPHAPALTIPLTMCHEMAHQRGVAQEDSANYIGFLACINNEELVFQYSGYIYSLSALSNQLYKVNSEQYYSLNEGLSDAVIRDLRYVNSFWNKHINKTVEKLNDTINDTYLKSNNQPEGIQNYNNAVLMLLNYFDEVLK